MAVEVMIKRKFKLPQARELINLIIQLRLAATTQPGYISGETLRNIHDPGECLVISTWESIKNWENWFQTKERIAIQDKIDALLGGETKYEMYEPLVGRVLKEHFIPEKFYTRKTEED
jgi:heme-degrading monooxygenase HmoA